MSDHGDHGDWFKEIEHLAGTKAKLPTYPGYKPFLTGTGKVVRPKLGKPSVRVYWYQDWGMWAWLLLFGGIILFAVKWPYAFGYTIGSLLMGHWLLPGV